MTRGVLIFNEEINHCRFVTRLIYGGKYVEDILNKYYCYFCDANYVCDFDTIRTIRGYDSDIDIEPETQDDTGPSIFYEHQLDKFLNYLKYECGDPDYVYEYDAKAERWKTFKFKDYIKLFEK